MSSHCDPLERLLVIFAVAPLPFVATKEIFSLGTGLGGIHRKQRAAEANPRTNPLHVSPRFSLTFPISVTTEITLFQEKDRYLPTHNSTARQKKKNSGNVGWTGVLCSSHIGHGPEWVPRGEQQLNCGQWKPKPERPNPPPPPYSKYQSRGLRFKLLKDMETFKVRDMSLYSCRYGSNMHMPQDRKPEPLFSGL